MAEANTTGLSPAQSKLQEMSVPKRIAAVAAELWAKVGDGMKG